MLKNDDNACIVPILIRPPLCDHNVELLRLSSLQQQRHYYARVTMDQNSAAILQERKSNSSVC